MVRGSELPLILALVPVMGRPSSRANSRGIGCAGTRTATVGPSAVRRGGQRGGTAQNQRQRARPVCLGQNLNGLRNITGNGG